LINAKTPEDPSSMAGLSLDLDNKWSYLKTHGDTGWQDFPTYFDLFLPSLLDLLDEAGLKITFFIVGQDAALSRNRALLSLLARRGHEAGNHSYHHEPWLHRMSRERVQEEVLKTEELIAEITGEKPAGFRGPGFSWCPTLLDVLAENGYLYDSTTLPTCIGPLARLFYFWKARLSEEQKAERSRLYGGWRDGTRTPKPYYWRLDSGRHCLEIPITTAPFLKTPFHLSYLLYLSRFSEGLMTGYLSLALRLCKMTRTPLNFLLHPLDFLGIDQVPELAFFPGMDIDRLKKIEIFKRVMARIRRDFTPVPLNRLAAALHKKGRFRYIRARHE
jgi:hypothetical protein